MRAASARHLRRSRKSGIASGEADWGGRLNFALAPLLGGDLRLASARLYGVCLSSTRSSLRFGGPMTYRDRRSARESRTAARREVISGSAGLDSETGT